MSPTLSPRMSRDNDDPRVRVMFVALIVACGVITVLTGAAFWLSYAHLASVAGTYGLGGSPARQWAWPATLDLFIIAGEVLMFVAALKGRRDLWAIGLTVAGSVGSIGLNVSGVGAHAPFLAYVVAGVPPLAALLAFGALMRQVHHFIVSLSPTPVVPGGEDKGQAAVSPEPSRDSGTTNVPAHVPAAPVVSTTLSRPRAAVPAVSPARPAVRIRVDKTPEEIKAERDMSPVLKADVPEDVRDNLTAIVRFLRETDHTEDEIRAIVPTLPGHEETGSTKRDSLKKAIQRTRPKN